MRIPRLALTAIAVTLATTTAATAAPRVKPMCLIVKDADTNDGNSNLLPGVSSPMVDIISADIATGKTELVAVLRLAQTSNTGDTWSKLRYDWVFGSNANGLRYDFRAALDGNGRWSSGAQIGSMNPPHTFTIDHKTKSFVWKVKRKDVKEMARPKLVWSKFNVNTSIFSSTADSADANNAKYPDKYPSCVRAV